MLGDTINNSLSIRDNFFNPEVLTRQNIRRQGRVVVNFSLDYQIEQNNLLRENIEKIDYLNTGTSYEKREKLTPKKFRCCHETPMRAGMINKRRNKHKLLVSNKNGTIIRKKTGN